MSNNVFIHHIGITAPAAVLDEVVTFYDNILGLKPGYRPEFGGLKGFWLYAGEQPIVHLLEDPGRNGEKSGHFDHVALRCDNLQQVVQNLERHNISFGQLATEELNQTQLFLTDPSGTTVELNFISQGSE